jgi:hypothetical protein
MHDGVTAVVGADTVHGRAIRHRSDDVGVATGRCVEADDGMPRRSQRRREEAAEPA